MDKIEIAEYDPEWPQRFELEAAHVRAVLPLGLILAIEHFGSTAIPGMSAKPIIDILVTVASVQEARATAVEPLESVGYAFWADNPRRDRLFFVKGLLPFAPQRTHHIHILEHGREAQRLLHFRDYLRANAHEADRYGALKFALAARYASDREAYTAAKEDYIAEIVARSSSVSA
jgi:GrpB-like predicted nucleotidyltransferase (UPF0157 family)